MKLRPPMEALLISLTHQKGHHLQIRGKPGGRTDTINWCG